MSCVQAAFLGCKNSILDIKRKLFNQVCSYLPCLQAPSTSTISYHFHWPRLYQGFVRSAQSKTIWLHFSQISYGVEAIQVKPPDTTFERDLMKQGKEVLFKWRCQKILTLAYIRAFIIWFGSNKVWWWILLNTTVWCNAYWPWPSFKVTGVQESNIFCCNYLKVFDRFARILLYCWDLFVWWTSYSLYLINSIFKIENFMWNQNK